MLAQCWRKWSLSLAAATCYWGSPIVLPLRAVWGAEMMSALKPGVPLRPKWAYNLNRRKSQKIQFTVEEESS